MRRPTSLFVLTSYQWYALANASSITEELPPITQRLDYEGDVDPGVINRYQIHVDMNRANYDAEGGPPSLPLRASALLCSEFLALIHPPDERTLDHALGTIAPVCEDVDGGGITCRLDNYVVYEGKLQFSYVLTYAEFSLPGMDDPGKIGKDENPLPSKGATIKARFDVLDRKERGRKALEGIVGIISEMFGLKEQHKTLIEEVDQGGGAEERTGRESPHKKGSNEDEAGKDEL